MSRQDQVAFLRSFCDEVRDHLVGLAHNVPEGWDGLELREWVADEFKGECHLSSPFRKDLAARRRSYRREVARLTRF